MFCIDCYKRVYSNRYFENYTPNPNNFDCLSNPESVNSKAVTLQAKGMLNQITSDFFNPGVKEEKGRARKDVYL